MNIARTAHIAAYLWQTASWNRLNSCKSSGRSAKLFPALQQCISGACSSVWDPARLAESGWWLMSSGGTLARIVRCGSRWTSAMKELTACLQLGPHLCDEVFCKKIQAGVPESDSEASFEDYDLVLHGSQWSWTLSMELSMWSNATVYCRNAWCCQHSCYSGIRYVWRSTVSHVIVSNYTMTSQPHIKLIFKLQAYTGGLMITGAVY